MQDNKSGTCSFWIANGLFATLCIMLIVVVLIFIKIFTKPIPPTITTPQTFAETPKNNPVSIDKYPCPKGYVCTDKGQIKTN